MTGGIPNGIRVLRYVAWRSVYHIQDPSYRWVTLCGRDIPLEGGLTSTDREPSNVCGNCRRARDTA